MITNEQIAQLRAQRDEYERHMAEDDCPMPVNVCPTEWDYHTTVNDLLPDLLDELKRLRAVESKAKALIEAHKAVLQVHILPCDMDSVDAAFAAQQRAISALRFALEATATQPGEGEGER